MTDARQELKQKICKIINPAYKSHLENCSCLVCDKANKILALIPPWQEVMSEEEIGWAIFKELNSGEGEEPLRRFWTGKHHKSPSKEIASNISQALSGRIAKPEAQKTVERIEKLLPPHWDNRTQRYDDSTTIRQTAKINELVEAVNELKERGGR